MKDTANIDQCYTEMPDFWKSRFFTKSKNCQKMLEKVHKNLPEKKKIWEKNWGELFPSQGIFSMLNLHHKILFLNRQH